jgi:hypothetical protein
VTIAIVTDKAKEGDETVVVGVVQVTNAVSTGDTGTLTIVDDDKK